MNDYQHNIKEHFKYCLIFFAIMIGLCALCSCSHKSIEYVDREVVKYNTKEVHDTTYIDRHDSIYHTIFQKGDTIYDTKYVEKVRYKDRMVYKCDTLTRDSIQIQEKTIEKEITPKWCYYSLVSWLIIIIFATLKVRKWLH